jgi:hypothetical protein
MYTVLSQLPEAPQRHLPQEAWDEAVPFTLTLDVDMNSIGDSEAFKRDVIQDVATAAKIDAKHVKVTALRAGSVIVDMLIAKEAGDAQKAVRDLEEQLESTNSLLKHGKVTSKAVALEAAQSTALEATQSTRLLRSAPVNGSSAARFAGTAPVVADAARTDAARIHRSIHAFSLDSEQGIGFVLVAAMLCFYVTLWKLGDEHCSSGGSSPCGPYLRVATIWTWPRHAGDMLGQVVPQDSFARKTPLLVTVRHSLENVSAKLDFRMWIRDEAFVLVFGWRRRLPPHLRTLVSSAWV